MRTRGKIWNPGAATFQRVCFPGYGDSQSDKRHSMPVQQPVRQAETSDDSEGYQVSRGKVDRVRTSGGDRYVLPSYDVVSDEKSFKENVVPQEPLFFSNRPVHQPLSGEIQSRPVRETPNYASPMAYADSHEPSVKTNKEYQVPLTQQDFRNVIQREIEELRDQLTATLVNSMSSLVEDHQQASPQSTSGKPSEYDTDKQVNHESDRVQVAEINSESVSSYEQKAVQSKKVLSFYSSPVPQGSATSYQLPGSRHKMAKSLESKLCVSLPGTEMTSCELEAESPCIENIQASSVGSEQGASFAVGNWEQQSALLVPLIQKTCRELIQEEVQALREQLTGIIRETLKSVAISSEGVRESDKNNSEQVLTNRTQNKKPDPLKREVEQPQAKREEVKSAPSVKKVPDNISRLGCFSEAGAVAFRELRKNPEKVIKFQQKRAEESKPVKGVAERRRKVTEAQQNIKGLRDQLNAIVQGGAQFFSPATDQQTKPQNNKRAGLPVAPSPEKTSGSLVDVNRGEEQVGRSRHAAIAKYTTLSKQGIDDADESPSGYMKSIWRWGESGSRSANSSSSKAKPAP